MKIAEARRLRDEVFLRKSVRKYFPAQLPEPTLAWAVELCESAEAPLGGEAAFRVLSGEKVGGFGLKAPHVLAIYATPWPDAILSAAFRAQLACLALSAEGIGSCWMGMARPSVKDRVREGLPYVIGIAFGRPQEAARRSGPEEFKRKPLSEISGGRTNDKILEPLRLAPSAMNRQPWHVMGSGDALDLYVRRPNALGKWFGDSLMVDAGIALSHLYLSMKAEGVFGGFAREDFSKRTRYLFDSEKKRVDKPCAISPPSDRYYRYVLSLKTQGGG